MGRLWYTSPVLPHSAFPQSISLSLIISRANCHVPGKHLRWREELLIKSWPINYACVEYQWRAGERRRGSWNVKTAWKARKRRSHNVHRRDAGNHACGQSPGICIMRNYTCGNSKTSRYASANVYIYIHIYAQARRSSESVMIVGYIYMAALSISSRELLRKFNEHPRKHKKKMCI